MTTLLVTGAAGYLASWIVKCLLEEGHTVHGTVRRLGEGPKLAHLTALAERHPGRLVLFEADLLADASFDAAMQGCSLVIHAASPYFWAKATDPAAQLLKPAVAGTRNVLDAVNRTRSVTRVVVTSSVAAMYGNAADLAQAPANMLRESDANHSSTVQTNPYALSKTLAEQAAWAMHQQQSRWELVTIHPGAIFGPSLSTRTDATSVEMLMQFLHGSFRTGVPNMYLGVVDVRDVALAHMRAAMTQGAHGRYIVVSESLRLLEIAQLIGQTHPQWVAKLPTRQVPKAIMWLIAPLVGMTREQIARNVGYVARYDNTRSQAELNIDYRTPLVTVHDHVQQLLDDGLLAN